MFEIENKNQATVTVTTKKTSVNLNVEESTIDGNLEVGVIKGAGEFEIGDLTIRGISVEGGKVIYDIEIEGVHIGVIGGIEQGLDDLGMADILCTSSVRAVREIEPKIVVAMGNVDGMVSELKLNARMEKKLKIKNRDALPVSPEVVVLN